MPRNPLREFITDYLTPSERLSQALYGLILVLTVISAIGITVSRNQQSTSTLLTAALGTSVAWGMVDAVIYVLTGVHERSHHLRVASLTKKKPKDDAVRQIEEELDDTLIGILHKDEKGRIAEQVYLALPHASRVRQQVTKDDLLGGLASFLVTIIIVLPPMIPFVLNLPLESAIRLFNVIAVAMLFVVGFMSCQCAELGGWKRLRWAITITILGVVIVFVTILLGG